MKTGGANLWSWITKPRPLALCAFCLALLLYLPTLAPDLTGRYHSTDGAELITAAVTGGIPHPPSYPTYLLLGRLFSHLPWGTMAWRFHLLSAVGAAVGVGFLTAALLAQHPRHATAALATALTVGATPLLWHQATIAEVYTVNMAVLAALLWALVSQQRPWLVGLLWGLSLTTHLTSALWGGVIGYWLLVIGYSSPAVGVGLVPTHSLDGNQAVGDKQERATTRVAPTVRRLGELVGGFVVGCLPWALLPVWARGDSPVVWGDATTLAGWWWLVTAALYRPNLWAAEWGVVWMRLSHWGITAVGQWAAVGWLAWGWGVWQTRADGWARVQLATAALYALYAVGYAQPDAHLTLLPALLLLSGGLMRGLQTRPRVALLLPFMMVALHLQAFRPATMVRPTAEAVLAELPPHALLLTTGDRATFNLWYFQSVEQMRPDVVIVDTDLLAFDWYRRRLQQQHPALRGLAQDDEAAVRTLNKQFPLCTTNFTTTQCDD